MIVVDPNHWLTEQGDLPDEPRLRNQMLRVAALIEYGGPLPVMHWRETLIPCRRRPKGKPCMGLLAVVKESDERLYAHCTCCGSDEYVISNWKDTLWADGPMPPEPVELVTMH